MPDTLTPEAFTALTDHALTPSDWILVDQARINAFADTTEDHQFIHVDPEAAAQSPFGGTIAHGFLTLSLLSRMAPPDFPRVAGHAMGVNYGFEKVRFLAPVPVGRRVRGHFTILNVTQRRPNEYLVRISVQVEIEGEEKSALMAEWLNLQIATPDGD